MMDNENQNQPNQKRSGNGEMEHFQRSLTTGNGSFPTANDIKERSLSTRSLVFSAHPWDWLEVWQVNI